MPLIIRSYVIILVNFSIIYLDNKLNNIYSYLIFNCLICDSRSLKSVLGYGLVVLVWFVRVLGCLNGPRKDKTYAYLPELSGKSNGTKL